MLDVRHYTLCADAARLPLKDGAVDLVFGSPPYCDARDYGIGADRGCAEWVDWMLGVTEEAMRVCRGPVMWVVGDVTRDRCYWPAAHGLMWEWWRRGGEHHLYRPAHWQRVGIPGSGGDEWLRADVEYVLCFKRPGGLPWSDNAANGHPPKWAPGGEMSYRLSDGSRVNQSGHVGHGAGRGKVGAPKKARRPSHREHSKRAANGEVVAQGYVQPTLANPGNLVRVNVGGGMMGHSLAHENEACFPVALAKWFIRSWCPPGGTVLDPFVGSGTTMQAAIELGRNAIGSDIRQSQCELSLRRLRGGVQREFVA